MNKLFSILVISLILISNKIYPQITIQYAKLDANNISSYFWNTGLFDRNPTLYNSPGFEWPKDSGKHAIFSTGLTLAGRVDGLIRMAACKYQSEYAPGYCIDSIPYTNSNFKVYKVSRGDNQNTNPDWANWGLMVPYGAPYVDVNLNGIYEPAIDTPGVRNAASTIFVCITDGFISTHQQSNDFGGNTLPLYAEVHLTAWAYTQLVYADMQFIKFEIINKGKKSWTNFYSAVTCDPDLGQAEDDFLCCDTIRNLGICYNADSVDGYGGGNVYGLNPPASGIKILKGLINKSVIPYVALGMTSFNFCTNVTGAPPPCEAFPNGQPLNAYYFMKGFKGDSSNWMDRTQPLPQYHKKTKFCYYGDPETNLGWTEKKGCVQNCGGDSGYILFMNPMGDRTFTMGCGAHSFNFLPGDTQTVYICQMVARGTSNVNSVTKLKQLADVAQNLYNSNFIIGVRQISSVVPEKNALFQNYPNPFNPTTSIKYQVESMKHIKLVVFDILGREVATLVNQKQSPGTYEVIWDARHGGSSALPSGVYFCRMSVDNQWFETRRLILMK